MKNKYEKHMRNKRHGKIYIGKGYKSKKETRDGGRERDTKKKL